MANIDKVGNVFVGECKSIGKSGDGVFFLETGKVVFVPTAEEGKMYKVKINKVATKISFGEVVSEVFQ